MKFTTIHKVAIAFVLAFSATKVLGAGEDKTAMKLGYPELEVTPRASERLFMEAKAERDRRWSTHLPVQISALATLAAGMVVSDEAPERASQKKLDDAEWASRTGMIVGGAWLLLTGYMALDYEPYATGYQEIKNLSAEGERHQLLRERLAEESLERAARRASRIKWLSVTTNLAASLYMASAAGESGVVVAGISAVLALNPIIFPYHWERVADQHRLYKKRIYGPVAGLAPVGGRTNSHVMTMGIAASF